ncbi:hypothetical protein [Thermococcus alcaliphilus]|uniref:hypothetical protein n=1 Tax=Thermococcus alcaliphilus TaxID=139207 RepID=UPI00209154DA|nr:hypothetical protein [Thermococcus alcaliphilus]MCO6041632.1 hypothetical protein [Thermococcus alcaliphilus]
MLFAKYEFDKIIAELEEELTIRRMSVRDNRDIIENTGLEEKFERLKRMRDELYTLNF